MCDYSLHAVNNRLAVEGEQLFVHKFHTGSKGLASEADLRGLEDPAPACAGIWARLKHWFQHQRQRRNGELMSALPAVCIPPGAKLYLEGIPEMLQEKYRVGEAEEVVFTQVTAEPFRYRDAFRFANGAEVLIQKFDEGVRIEVIQLAIVEEATVETQDLASLPVPSNLVERGMSANA